MLNEFTFRKDDQDPFAAGGTEEPSPLPLELELPLELLEPLMVAARTEDGVQDGIETQFLTFVKASTLSRFKPQNSLIL